MQATSSKTDVRRYYHSSSFVMALLFTLLLGTAAVIIAYSGYYFGNEYFIRSAAQVIATETRYLTLEQEQGRLGETLDKNANVPGRIYGLIHPDGTITHGRLRHVPVEKPALGEGVLVFTNEDGSATYGAGIHNFSDGTRLLVGVDITEMLQVGWTIRLLGIITIVLMGIVILTSFLISTFVVTRTNRIADTAKDIMDTGDLSRRIAIDGRWDDLSNMAYVLNAFLERLESLLTGVRRVSDNIAHDLRTPLTRLRNNLESLRDQSDEQDPRRASYDSLIIEADRLLSTFNALLRIARIETSKQRTQFRALDLRNLVLDVVDLYEPLAEEKNISLNTILPQSVPYVGDSDLLFQAVANLLDNGIKFTPERGTISLQLALTKQGVQLRVQDSGPGIPEADQEKVFDRFYRAEASRTTPGNGLGLSLVAAVVTLHDGKITLANRTPGLEIVIDL